MMWKAVFVTLLLFSSLTFSHSAYRTDAFAQAQDGEITLVRGIDWHPTETVVAMTALLDGRSGIVIVNMMDQSQQFVSMQNTALSVAWSPTGDRLAVVQGGTQYTAQILTWPGLIEQTTFPLAQSAQELSIFE